MPTNLHKEEVDFACLTTSKFCHSRLCVLPRDNMNKYISAIRDNRYGRLLAFLLLPVSGHAFRDPPNDLGPF